MLDVHLIELIKTSKQWVQDRIEQAKESKSQADAGAAVVAEARPRRKRVVLLQRIRWWRRKPQWIFGRW